MFKNIVVAHDGTDCSDGAFDYAIALAKLFNSTLTVCHVTNYASAAPVVAAPGVSDLGPMCEVLYRDSKAIAHHILEYAREAGVRVTIREVSDLPERGILEVANDSGADLVVLGTHQRRGFQRLLAPSVSEHIVRDVHVPVLIVPSDSVDREEKERHHVNTARA